MIKTIYNAEEVFLLNDRPNWSRGFSAEFASQLNTTASLVGREARRPYGNSLLCVLKFSVSAVGPDLVTLQARLKELKAQSVLVPFWPSITHWSDILDMEITGGLMVAFKQDWSQYEIYVPGAEPVWPEADDFVAPLLRGFLKTSDIKWANPEFGPWPVTFTESSPYAERLQFSPVALSDGPTPAGHASAPKFLPFRSSFKDVSESIVVQVQRNNIGFAREQDSTFYPHEPARAQTASYVLDGLTSIAQALAWFSQDGSQGACFWSQAAFLAARLANPSMAGDTDIDLQDADALIVGDYVCATSRAGVFAGRKVTAKAGDQISIDSALGFALDDGWGMFQLILSTFTGKSLVLDFKSPAIALMKMSIRQLKTEEIVPGGETEGTTLGRLTTRIVLFELSRDYGNGTVDVQRFTNFEQDIEWDGNIWASGSYGCGDINFSVNLENDSSEITSSLVNPDGTLNADNPFVQDVSLQSEAPLFVKIYFADVGVDAGVESNMLGVGGEDILGVGGENIQGNT